MTTAAATAPLAITRRDQRFVATFRPAAHWSVRIRRHAGARGVWRSIWIVGAGPHRGEWACIPEGSFAQGLAWAPESELTEREGT